MAKGFMFHLSKPLMKQHANLAYSFSKNQKRKRFPPGIQDPKDVLAALQELK